jgi:acyl carrier protein
VKERIRTYLIEHAATKCASIDDDESLLEAGVIDSVTMLDLVAHLEREYAIKIDEDEMTPENFDSLSAIVRFVTSKKSA